MVGAEDAVAGGEDVPMVVRRLLVATEVVQRVGEVAAAEEGVRVVRAEDAFTGREDLVVEVGRLLMPAEEIERVGKVVAAVQGVGMVGAQGAGSDLVRRMTQLECAAVIARFREGLADVIDGVGEVAVALVGGVLCGDEEVRGEETSSRAGGWCDASPAPMDTSTVRTLSRGSHYFTGHDLRRVGEQ